MLVQSIKAAALHLMLALTASRQIVGLGKVREGIN